jgi:hypothetical protein
MNGRSFLDAATDSAAGPREAHWRTAAGRAYYALLHEARLALERWGFPMPPGESIHTFVRRRFAFAAHSDLKALSDTLDRLARLRNQADYQLAAPGPFANSARVWSAVSDSRSAIALLDQIDADPVRLAAAAAAVRAAFPP